MFLGEDLSVLLLRWCALCIGNLLALVRPPTPQQLGRSIDRRPPPLTVSQLVYAVLGSLPQCGHLPPTRVVLHGVKTTAVEVRAVSYEGSSLPELGPEVALLVARTWGRVR